MLGAMGEGIEVFFFPANSADAPIAVASKEGAFSVTVGTQTFQWRLPLAALMPQKVCPRRRRENERRLEILSVARQGAGLEQAGRRRFALITGRTPSSAWTRRPPGNLLDASGDWLSLAAPWRTP